MGLPSQSAPAARGEAVALGPQRRLRAVGHAERAEDAASGADFTVFSLISSRRAMSLFGRPSTSSSSTSRSRAESAGERVGLGARVRTVRAARGSSGGLAAGGGADALGDLVRRRRP